jgi:plasmid stability protein
MHAHSAYNACMIQYTIRKIPDYLDKAARERAGKTGESLNTVLVEALKRGLSVHEKAPEYGDMDDLIGSWVHDPEIEQTLESFDRVDGDLWE